MGLAGAGKTTLTARLVEILASEPGGVCAANLDPGVSSIPYSPEFDIRYRVTVREIMEREGLGPNGALMRAMEIAAASVEELVDWIRDSPCDRILIDTPGQMEVFAFRPEGRKITGEISTEAAAVGVFLGDHGPGRSIADAVGTAMLAKVVEMMLSVPVIPVMNKADLAGSGEAGKIWEAVLRGEIEEVEPGLSLEGGVASEALLDMIKALSSFRTPIRIPIVSALTGEGVDELIDLVREVWCSCGDLT